MLERQEPGHSGPASAGDEPALSDESFTSRVKLTENDLPGKFENPGN